MQVNSVNSNRPATNTVNWSGSDPLSYREHYNGRAGRRINLLKPTVIIRPNTTESKSNNNNPQPPLIANSGLFQLLNSKKFNLTKQSNQQQQQQQQHQPPIQSQSQSQSQSPRQSSSRTHTQYIRPSTAAPVSVSVSVPSVSAVNTSIKPINPVSLSNNPIEAELDAKIIQQFQRRNELQRPFSAYNRVQTPNTVTIRPTTARLRSFRSHYRPITAKSTARVINQSNSNLPVHLTEPIAAKFFPTVTANEIRNGLELELLDEIVPRSLTTDAESNAIAYIDYLHSGIFSARHIPYKHSEYTAKLIDNISIPVSTVVRRRNSVTNNNQKSTNNNITASTVELTNTNLSTPIQQPISAIPARVAELKEQESLSPNSNTSSGCSTPTSSNSSPGSRLRRLKTIVRIADLALPEVISHSLERSTVNRTAINPISDQELWVNQTEQQEQQQQQQQQQQNQSNTVTDNNPLTINKTEREIISDEQTKYLLERARQFENKLITPNYSVQSHPITYNNSAVIEENNQRQQQQQTSRPTTATIKSNNNSTHNRTLSSSSGTININSTNSNKLSLHHTRKSSIAPNLRTANLSSGWGSVQLRQQLNRQKDRERQQIQQQQYDRLVGNVSNNMNNKEEIKQQQSHMNNTNSIDIHQHIPNIDVFHSVPWLWSRDDFQSSYNLSLEQQCLGILAMFPNDRSELHIKKLKEWILKTKHQQQQQQQHPRAQSRYSSQLAYLLKLPEQVLLSILRVMKVQRLNAGSIVYNNNDIAEQFYLLYSGTCEMLIKYKLTAEEAAAEARIQLESVQSQSDSSQQPYPRSRRKSWVQHIDIQSDPNRFHRERRKSVGSILEIIETIPSGSSFGHELQDITLNNSNQFTAKIPKNLNQQAKLYWKKIKLEFQSIIGNSNRGKYKTLNQKLRSVFDHILEIPNTNNNNTTNNNANAGLTSIHRRHECVRTVSDCILLTVSFNAFESIEYDYQSQQIQLNIQFFGSIPLFKLFDTNKLRQLQSLCTVKYFNKGAIIYQQSSPIIDNDTICFIESGSIELIRSILLTKSDRYPINNKSWKQSETTKIVNCKFKTLNKGDSIGLEAIEQNYNNPIVNSNIDTVNLLTRRDYTVKCDSNQCKLWFISKKHFHSLTRSVIDKLIFESIQRRLLASNTIQSLLIKRFPTAHSEKKFKSIDWINCIKLNQFKLLYYTGNSNSNNNNPNSILFYDLSPKSCYIRYNPIFNSNGEIEFDNNNSNNNNDNDSNNDTSNTNSNIISHSSPRIVSRLYNSTYSSAPMYSPINSFIPINSITHSDTIIIKSPKSNRTNAK